MCIYLYLTFCVIYDIPEIPKNCHCDVIIDVKSCKTVCKIVLGIQPAAESLISWLHWGVPYFLSDRNKFLWKNVDVVAPASKQFWL